MVYDNNGGKKCYKAICLNQTAIVMKSIMERGWICYKSGA